MMDVYWLEQTEANVPAEDDWLSESEAAHLSGLLVPKRRADWRLGRWTAKRALAACLKLPTDTQGLKRLEIRPAPSGAPEAFLADQPAGVRISISHRAGSAVCSVAMSDAALGCDLELIEPRSYAFTADYFTTEEQVLVSRSSVADRPRLIALIWSAKESALKALQTGLRLDTRCMAVSPTDAVRGWVQHAPEDWRPLEVRYAGGQSFHGWWRHAGNFLLTLVAAPPPGSPILLKIAP
ncbi:4'-phosphopantetheinyl transferase [Candidatus Sulfopaludibacter sp. SbA6]|nr:4'-phosphopantetheinyl transferase [Candidatus Sulfopaludibacter sp. SbA6]